jgi:tetratricopeptide (TPR) repeat protein
VGPIDTPVALGRELKRWIRHGTGRPMKVPALARRLNISQSSLYAYLAGTTLPPAETLDDLLHQLAVPDGERARLVTAREELLGRRDKSAAAPVPRQLPPDPAGFIGRDIERGELGEALRLARAHSAAPVVATISGPAGIGKTELAVHWAHRVVDEFPDGCLYADLRGFSPGEPRLPGDVLAGFLRGLGTAGQLPDDLDERAAWYRSALAGRRLLVVLDNGCDSDQVRPLLPDTPSCFVVVTSRSDLAGLSLRPGTHRISLDVLPERDQCELLRTHIGSRVSDDPAAVRELADRCAGLPLALRVMSAHAARQPDQPLAELAADLSQEQGLDQFDLGEAGAAVRTVFSWSDKRLPPRAAEDFRLLGTQPLAELDSHAAAALLGSTPAAARHRLDVLAGHHLVQRRAGGRYGMHDLIRAYAGELSTEVGDRDCAVTRLLDHYIAAAARAAALLHPRDPQDEVEHGHATVPLDDPTQARSWLDTEWPNLLALAAFSANDGWPQHTIRLAATLRRHLDESGLYSDAVTLLGHALHACRTTGDQGEEGTTLYHLGVAYLRLGRLGDATAHHQRALQLCRATGDRYGEAGALNSLGNVMERLGRYDEATDNYKQAQVLARELGLHHGEATLLNNLGYVAARQARHDTAQDHCQRALDLYRELDNVAGAARALVNLGMIAHQLHRYDEALTRYQDSLALSRKIGARGIEVEALNGLGGMYRTMRDLDQARSSHEAALAAARELADPYDEALSMEGLGHVAAAAEAPEDAARHWNAALAIYRRLRVPEADQLQALCAGLVVGNDSPGLEN